MGRRMEARTYQIRKDPRDMVAASCEQADCLAFANGWETVIDESEPIGVTRAQYIRRESGRRFDETHGDDGLTRFRFGPGQRCFRSHTVASDLFSIRIGGDRAQAVEAARWVDSFHDHVEVLTANTQEG